MRKSVMMSLIAAMFLLENGAYGYDEGASSPYTVKFGVGAGTNNASNGYDNTFIGVYSGYSNTTGGLNVFTGHESGYSNTTGAYNVFTGFCSGYSNTTGDSNVFTGHESGQSNTTGSDNVFTGDSSGYTNTDGSENTFIGSFSGYNADVNASVFVGCEAGRNSDMNGTFVGYKAGYNNRGGTEDNGLTTVDTGAYNTFIGQESGYSNVKGSGNTFLGYFAGHETVGEVEQGNFGLQFLHGSYNTYLGSFSGQNSKQGYKNTFIGYASGENADVNASVFIGYEAGASATRNNTLYIANDGTDDPLIYGEFDTKVVKINGDLNTTGPVTASFSGSTDKQALKMMDIRVNNTNDDKKSDVGFSMTNAREGFTWSFRTWEPTKGFAIAKYGNGATKEFRLEDTDPTDATTVVLRLANGAYCDGVWHDASSRSYKKDIKPLDSEAAQNAFAKLQPVTYLYKSHPQDTHVGFIAEDVPQLVADPGRKSVSTMDIVALLTKVLQVQGKTLTDTKAELKKKEAEIALLKKQQKEQAKEIAKLKKMEVKLSRLESLLTNLALKTKSEEIRLTSGLK
ncbi:tail fiber domain-containing protein [Nitratifractor sp.]